MFKKDQIVKLNWDGPVSAFVAAVDGDQVTIQRGAGLAVKGEPITLHQEELAGMVSGQFNNKEK